MKYYFFIVAIGIGSGALIYAEYDSLVRGIGGGCLIMAATVGLLWLCEKAAED